MTPRVGEHREGQVDRLLLVLMGARLALALGSLCIGVLLDALGREVPATEWPGFYVTVALCFVATLIYRPFVGRIQRPRAFAACNVGTDLALVTALVIFSGGKESVFTFLYVVVGLYGGVLFPGWGALSCSIAGSAAYGLVLGLGHGGWFGVGEAWATEPAAVLVTSWLVHASAMMAAGGLSGFLARELVRTGNALDERTQDLAHLRTLHQRTVESLKSGLLTTDLDGRVTSFNLEAQRITGLTRSQALGRDLEEVLPGIGALMSDGRASGLRGRARMPYAGSQGRTIHLGIGRYVLRDASGAAGGEVVIFQDVTAVVAMEQELRRAERLAAIGELSASIAHEIRNPLAAISGSIQMMRDPVDVPPGESKRLMGIVLREVDRLDRLIGDFLQFARPGEPQVEWIQLADAIGDVLEMAEGSRPAGVTLESAVEPELAVQADPGQLRQVLWNLLLNAIQAMPRGGQVRIEARADRGPRPSQEPVSGDRMDEEKAIGAEIVVMDQGAGIPAEVADHVFDPFFTTKPGGTGLGLAIVHRTIAEHRGTVRVGPGADGYRTAIRVWLPHAEVGT